MLSMEPYFTPSVGVAPGTTTMALSGLGCDHLGNCPPDERWMYTVPPVVDTSPGNPAGGASGPIEITQTSASAPLAVTAPSMLPHTTLPPGTRHIHHWNPYATESTLRGLRDIAPPRWGVVLAAGLFVFAAILGVGYLRRKR